MSANASREGPLAAGIAGPVVEINRLALGLLAVRSAAESPAALPPLLSALAPLWAGLDGCAFERAAHCPCLLVEFDLDALLSGPRVAESGLAHPGSPWFEGPAASRLAYLAMTHAWHLARLQPLAARLLLGLTDSASARLAALSLPELGECLDRAADLRWLRPRWDRQLEVWRELLSAAGSAEAERHESLRLRGVQLMAGAFWAREDPPAPRKA